MKNFGLSMTTKGEFDKSINKLLSENPSQKFFVNITKKEKKRSIPANAQCYAWIPDISNFICEDVKTTTQIIKLDFGLPIVLADEQIGHRYGTRLQDAGFFNFTREKQVEWMEFIQVTSLMNTKQHNKMRDDILYFYNQAGLDIGYKK
jgi:hypothetical protein